MNVQFNDTEGFLFVSRGYCLNLG